MRVDRILLTTTLVAGLALTGESFGYVLNPSNWAWHNNPVEEPFRLNTSSFPNGFGGGPISDVEDRYTSALDRWTYDSGAELVLTYGGLIGSTSWSNDSYNTTQYHTGPNGTALAVAQYWMSNGNMKDCDIRVYGQSTRGVTNWSADPNGPGNHEQDLERTLTHEMGHCIGLGHSSVGGAIMWPSQSTGTSLADRELSSDDKAGAKAIYGAAANPPPPPPPPDPDADLVLTGLDLEEIGDGDGVYEVGEQIRIRFAAENHAVVDAVDVEAVTSTEDPDVRVVTARSTPSLGPDLLATSSDDLVGTVVEITESCRESHAVDFEVVVDADNAPAKAYGFEIDVQCGLSMTASETWKAGQPAWVEVQGALAGEEIRFERTVGGPGRARCLPRPGVACDETDGPGKEVHLAIADGQGVARWDFVIPGYTRNNAQMWVHATATRDGGDVILKAGPVVRRVRR